MTTTAFSPDGLLQPVPYNHVSIATGTRHVHVAGQIARQADGTHVAPADLTGQVEQALCNMATALTGAGATLADVVRLRFFVTQWRPELMADFMQGVENIAKEIGLELPMPPVSLIGVDILFEPDVLVEVEAYAIVD